MALAHGNRGRSPAHRLSDGVREKMVALARSPAYAHCNQQHLTAASTDQLEACLRAPWLAVTDGAPGLVRAGKELWPEAGRQRCSVHRLRNNFPRAPWR